MGPMALCLAASTTTPNQQYSYVYLLFRRAGGQEGAARQSNSDSKTSVRIVSDFWVQVFEKHEGPGPAEDDKEEQ